MRVNRAYLEADVRILTGFIEPHFFAGFSGGPKAILPSLAGAESVFTNHGLAMIAHPKATWGITEGNPIWEEMREVALRTEPTFLLNVTLNVRRRDHRRFRRGHAGRRMRPVASSSKKTPWCPSTGLTTLWSPPTAAIRSTRTCTNR